MQSMQNTVWHLISTILATVITKGSKNQLSLYLASEILYLALWFKDTHV